MKYSQNILQDIISPLIFEFFLFESFLFQTVWSIVRPGRPKHLDGRTATFATFRRTDYVVGTWLLVDNFERKDKEKYQNLSTNEVLHVNKF